MSDNAELYRGQEKVIQLFADLFEAKDRLTALETSLRDCLRHMKTAGDPDAVRACEAAEELLGVKR